MFRTLRYLSNVHNVRMLFNKIHSCTYFKPIRPSISLFAGITAMGAWSAPIKFQEKEDPIIEHLKHAKLQYFKGNLSESEKLYHDALELIDTKFKDSTDRRGFVESRVYVYDHLANLAMTNMNLDKAETLFKETLKGLFELGYDESSNEFMEISLKLAMIYGMRGKVDDSEIGFAFCINSLKTKIESYDSPISSYSDDQINDLALLGMCHSSYCRFLMVNNRNVDAEKQIKKSIQIAESIFPENHNELFILQNDLATILSQLDKNAEAKEVLQSVLLKTNFLDDDVKTTVFLNFAKICTKLGLFDISLKYCNKAHYIAKKVNDKELMDDVRDCYEFIHKKKSS